MLKLKYFMIVLRHTRPNNNICNTTWLIHVVTYFASLTKLWQITNLILALKWCCTLNSYLNLTTRCRQGLWLMNPPSTSTQIFVSPTHTFTSIHLSSYCKSLQQEGGGGEIPPLYACLSEVLHPIHKDCHHYVLLILNTVPRLWG